MRLSNGSVMPIIGMGTAAITSAEAVRWGEEGSQLMSAILTYLMPSLTRVALDIGYRHFDCAEFYGNEEIVGEGLAPFVAAGKRDELYVVSKLWNTHHRPADVRWGAPKPRSPNWGLWCPIHPSLRALMSEIFIFACFFHQACMREESEGPWSKAPGPVPHSLARGLGRRHTRRT